MGYFCFHEGSNTSKHTIWRGGTGLGGLVQTDMGKGKAVESATVQGVPETQAWTIGANHPDCLTLYPSDNQIYMCVPRYGLSDTRPIIFAAAGVDYIGHGFFQLLGHVAAGLPFECGEIQLVGNVCRQGHPEIVDCGLMVREYLPQLAVQAIALMATTSRCRRSGFLGYLIGKWITNKNTLEYLSVWEKINNPNFNYPEFLNWKNQIGTSPKLA